MPRHLDIVLDDSVTNSTCGTCRYRHISWDEYTSSNDDCLITLMSCTLFEGEKVVDEHGKHTGWTHWLRGLDGKYIEGVYVETHESVMAGEPRLPIPETLRIKACLERERVQDPFVLNGEEWKALMEIIDNPPPAPRWLVRHLAMKKHIESLPDPRLTEDDD